MTHQYLQLICKLYERISIPEIIKFVFLYQLKITTVRIELTTYMDKDIIKLI